MRSTRIVLFAMVVLVAGGVATAQETRWLNVHVTEHGEGTNVEVHLPLNLVLKVLQSVDVDNFHAGKVDLELEDVEIDWPEILAAIKEAPDGDFVKVDSKEANVLVSKRSGTITINVRETEEESESPNAVVNVTVPASLIDALQVDEDNRIDVAALLQAFEKLPDGDLVTVDAEDARVRVWIE